MPETSDTRILYAGIDEAGYGPRLGPLSVACAALLVPADSAPPAQPACLWTLLRAGVVKAGADRRDRRDRRLVVDDSKRVLAGRGEAQRAALERGVVAFLTLASESGRPPSDDDALLALLAAQPPPAAWYAGPPRPLRTSEGEARVAASLLASAAGRAGVAPALLRCAAMGEGEFNARCAALGSKAAASFELVARHLRAVAAAAPCAGAFVSVDRQGGRTAYLAPLRAVFPDGAVEELERSAQRSLYGVAGAGAGPLTVEFRTGADGAHLPTALASMAAKLVRETLMDRFNAYWCGRFPEVKPTAGYALDAGRWLEDVRTGISPNERGALVRLA